MYFQLANLDVLLDEYTRLVNHCPSDPEDPGGKIDCYRLIHLLITEAKWTGLAAQLRRQLQPPCIPLASRAMSVSEQRSATAVS